MYDAQEFVGGAIGLVIVGLIVITTLWGNVAGLPDLVGVILVVLFLGVVVYNVTDLFIN